jgi:hypothetical protein
MKKVLLIVSAVFMVLLAGCYSPVGSSGDDPEDAVAVAQAGEKTTDVLNTALQAMGTGDYTKLNALLAAEDPQGDLAAILARHGVFGQGATKSFSDMPIVDMPHFWNGDYYTNGDVLLCRGSGNPVANLMQAILPKGYGHAGVLWKPADMPPIDSFPCVITAELALDAVGVSFQTWDEWNANDSVCVMRWGDVASRPDSVTFTTAIGTFADVFIGRTLYAFLQPLSPFQPVSKGDNLLWYCSKVAYRLYGYLLSTPEQSIEGSDFYGADPANTGQRWAQFTYLSGTPSLMYEVYWWYLRVTRPFKSKAWITNTANKQLVFVLGELVTPDELRWSPNLTRMWLFGSTAPEAEWGL